MWGKKSEQKAASKKGWAYARPLLFSLAIILAIVAVLWAVQNGKNSNKEAGEVAGLADTTHTWEFNSTTASDFQYNSDFITVDNGGARLNATTNRFTNPGFESNVSGWSLLPTPEGMPNLTMWLKADSITGIADGQTVTNWYDSSGNGLVATQANASLRPTYRASVINNLPSLQFGPSTRHAFGIAGLNAGNNVTIFIVADPDSTTPVGMFDSAPNAANPNSFRNYNSGFWEWWGTTPFNLSLPNANAVYMTVTGSLNPTRIMTYYRNGEYVSSTGSASTTGISWAAAPRIGDINEGSAGRYQGYISEIMVFSSVLTDDQRNNVNYYLKTKYNLAGSVTPSYAINHSTDSNYGSGNGSAIVVANNSTVDLTQAVNLGNTEQYRLTAYVREQNSTAVDETIAELYIGGEAVTTSYTDMGGGWWRLSTPFTGVSSSRDYGVRVKLGVTAYVDDLTLSRNAEHSMYNIDAYENLETIVWEAITSTQNSAGNATIRYQLCGDDGLTCESGSSWQYWDGDSWETATNSTTHTNFVAELDSDAMNLFSTTNFKMSFKAIWDFSGPGQATITDLSLGVVTDDVPPVTNASNTALFVNNGGREVPESGWTNSTSPYFEWDPGVDDPGGSGILGYCLYLGQDSGGDPVSSKGLLGVSPGPSDQVDCEFVVEQESIDLSDLALRGENWLVTDTLPYYLNIKAIDNAGVVYTGASEQFEFYFDDTPPSNVAFINPASGNFNSITDMNFSWPTSGGSASSDVGAGVGGWQYSINSTAEWLGSEEHTTLLVDLLPVGYAQPHFFDTVRDGDYIQLGDNVIYFRTIDEAGNTSLPSTYRTGSVSYGGSAPTFPGDGVVTVNPAVSDTNMFALSWPEATPADGRTIAAYYYMVNTTPPATLATLTGNSATYRQTTSTSVPSQLLTGAQRGSNTVRVVAVDDAGNYSPTNIVVGTFELNSDNPDPASNLTVSDASIKSISLWRAALAWDHPDYRGTGTLTYLIQRSLNGVTWTTVATTTGTAYVDTVEESRPYYWRIGVHDTSDLSINSPSFTNAVVLHPRGSYTEPPLLTSGPEATSVTTRMARINWTTDRGSDSKVAFGTASGEYFVEEPSNSQSVTDHIINLTNLSPGTTYYYVAKWTDEDGNTGTSEERVFTTAPAPTITDPRLRQAGLNSVLIEFTVRGASSVKIYYGRTPDFGGMKEIQTSILETTYTTEITGLDDGTKYFYRINPLDGDGYEYQGVTLSFETLPRPRISNVQLQQVGNRSQTTILVSWDTNTETTSIVTYYPTNAPSDVIDDVDIEMIQGKHEKIITGLKPGEQYSLVVSGVDRGGNTAISDIHQFTTATDTRAPQISQLRVVGGIVSQKSGDVTTKDAQLVISWKTDEPTTAQVEYGEGSGGSYSNKTLEDRNMSENHTVVISGLTPSKIYHFRVISKDAAGNETRSVDTITVAPKSSRTALELVLAGLSDTFSFIIRNE